ncbi:MAG: hypothetical protein AAGI08_06760 [Bacteroidota bacterium]
MGQQQLLLLVLGIVIVGIATVVGINAYSENTVKTNWDSLLQDTMRIANDAQQWKAKPELFGGSPDDTKSDQDDYSALDDFYELGYSADNVYNGGACYFNLNGEYQIDTTDDLEITAYNVANDNVVEVSVLGTTEGDIALVGYIRGGQAAAGPGNDDVAGAASTLDTSTDPCGNPA